MVPLHRATLPLHRTFLAGNYHVMMRGNGGRDDDSGWKNRITYLANKIFSPL